MDDGWGSTWIKTWKKKNGSISEMPTSGDLKSGDSLFFTTLPPRKFNEPPLPNPNKYGNDIGHYMKSYLKICDHRFDARNNLFQWLNRCKKALETVLRIRKFQVLSLKWAESQTRAQKSSKDDFIGEIWWPVQETGKLVSYLGNSWIIRESWHVCNFSSFYAMSAKVTMSLWLVFPDEIS